MQALKRLGPWLYLRSLCFIPSTTKWNPKCKRFFLLPILYPSFTFFLPILSPLILPPPLLPILLTQCVTKLAISGCGWWIPVAMLVSLMVRCLELGEPPSYLHPLWKILLKQGISRAFQKGPQLTRELRVSLYQYAIVDRMLVCNNLSTSLGPVKIQWLISFQLGGCMLVAKQLLRRMLSKSGFLCKRCKVIFVKDLVSDDGPAVLIFYTRGRIGTPLHKTTL